MVLCFHCPLWCEHIPARARHSHKAPLSRVVPALGRGSSLCCSSVPNSGAGPGQPGHHLSCRSLPGKGLCAPHGEGAAAASFVHLGWLCFPAVLFPAKGFVADLRILQCPSLLLPIVEMTNMCSVIRLTAFYAGNNAGSSGFRACGSCWACAVWQSSQFNAAAV